MNAPAMVLIVRKESMGQMPNGQVFLMNEDGTAVDFATIAEVTAMFAPYVQLSEPVSGGVVAVDPSHKVVTVIINGAATLSSLNIALPNGATDRSGTIVRFLFRVGIQSMAFPGALMESEAPSSVLPGDVILEIASDSGFTANVQTVSIAGLGQTYTLAVAIQGVQPQTSVVSGFVPAGYYARLRTVNNTGTPTFTYLSLIHI